MRKSSLFLAYIAATAAVVSLLPFHARQRQREAAASLSAMSDLVGSLPLTDLCLFTEARYTRNLSQAEFHVPFQDQPLALDHFPSGSLVSPPATIPRSHE